MLPIQAILVTLLLLIGGIYVTTLSSRLASRLAVLGLLAAGALFVINPDLTTRLAHSVGVGRGTDLLLYLFCLASITVFLKLYKKHRTVEEKLTEVARQVALLGAQGPGREAR
jgi:small membrane protein